MDDHDKLGAMFAVMEEQQAAVQSAIAGLARERKGMADAITDLQNTARSLQRATGEAAAQAVIESIGEGSVAASKALKAATEALNKAAGEVRGAGKWVTFKTAAALLAVGLVMVLAMFGMCRYMVDSELKEVERLRAEKTELEANVANLAKRGGKIQFNTCGGRLCIEASTNQGTDPQGNPTPLGGWSTTDNRKVPLVIPRGY